MVSAIQTLYIISMRAFYFLISILLANPCNLLAQDSTSLFESAKGSWACPIQKYSGVKKHKIKINKKWQYKIVQFFADSSYDVKAVFDGLVVSSGSVNGVFAVITKFGDYYITYSGLDKPIVNKGDFIKRGQKISTVIMNADGTYMTGIAIKRDDDYFDPYIWFQHKSCL